ncbi:MAG TPA: CoA-binding protein [Acidisoma sp.]|jgi:predicted CoA-binding protein|uniref:CoA-binding protein n=1 Tax=Acidisoma sp. TaxID=1872115 RepID=UPI002B9C79CC|nr:CoA-binding protein [Acidisoma sp.]HTI02101.1 CoA-binding protein [Acidisoma sp.]
MTPLSPPTDLFETTDETIRAVLTGYRRIALVGASAKPERPSHGVMGFLIRHGFEVTPVNPGLAGQVIHGRTVVASLDEAGPLEIVDIFRASDQVGPVVDEAIGLGAKVIWMQLGVVHREAAAKARAAGLTVIMDRCPAIEWPRLGLTQS